MSDKIYFERHQVLPNPTKPDTVYYIGYAEGKLQIAVTDTNNAIVYKTLDEGDVNQLIIDELSKNGGVLESIDGLQAMAHTHPNKNVLDLATQDGDGNFHYNGVSLRHILRQEDW